MNQLYRSCENRVFDVMKVSYLVIMENFKDEFSSYERKEADGDEDDVVERFVSGFDWIGGKVPPCHYS